MASSMTPSTAWNEHIEPDEAKRFEAYGPIFAAIQARKSKRYGKGRALHRKQLTSAQGTLRVLDSLPDFARQGLFALSGQFPVRVRLSNGGMDHASDKVPDIRGFAIKVQGVRGDSALGNGPATCQDFLLINQEQFAFPKSEEFVAFVDAASRGNGNLLKFLFRRYGVFGAPARLLSMVKAVGKSFGGFATENLFSAVPVANGPFAVRVRLVPAVSNGTPDPAAKADWGADFSRRLAKGDLHWDLQLQPFVSENLTPIEDASVNWPSPYTTVAQLSLPQQDSRSAGAQALSKEIEAGVFDPWQALAAHRPLGDVQRARKVVYLVSQKGRGAV
jgi:hypothetical protein